MRYALGALILLTWVARAVLAAAAVADEESPAVPPEVLRIEDETIAARRAIRSVHMKVAKTYWDFTAGTKQDEDLTFYFDTTRYRQDHCVDGSTLIDVFGESDYYSWRTDIINGTARFGLAHSDLESQKARRAMMLDPRQFMMTAAATGVQYGHKLDTMIKKPGRRDFTVTETTFDGQPALTVSYSRPKPIPLQVTYTVVPSRNYNIVGARLQGGTAKFPADLSVECTLQQVREGLWFPKLIKEREVRGPKKAGEDLDVTVISMNEPLPDSYFQPIGMNVPPGTHVDRYPKQLGEALKWDGSRIVPKTQQDVADIRMPVVVAGPPPAEARRARKFLYAAGLLSTAACAVFVLFYWRRQSA